MWDEINFQWLVTDAENVVVFKILLAEIIKALFIKVQFPKRIQ